MEDCESPRIPFQIFKQHFPVAPKVIIYDNTCKLHQDCLNRDPIFFKHTNFLVDWFHWRGHKGCSLGNNIDLYPNLNTINTRVNEQTNANIQKLKGHLSYMRLDNFRDGQVMIWGGGGQINAREFFFLGWCLVEMFFFEGSFVDFFFFMGSLVYIFFPLGHPS